MWLAWSEGEQEDGRLYAGSCGPGEALVWYAHGNRALPVDHHRITHVAVVGVKSGAVLEQFESFSLSPDY